MGRIKTATHVKYRGDGSAIECGNAPEISDGKFQCRNCKSILLYGSGELKDVRIVSDGIDDELSHVLGLPPQYAPFLKDDA